ncbi:MAG: hypothetical protein ACOY30_15090 [Bacillota bacterium]
MIRKIFLIILTAGLLAGGSAALITVNPKELIYNTAGYSNKTVELRSFSEEAGRTLKARLLKKAAVLEVPTEGRTLREIAGDVKEAIKAKNESVRKYNSIIRSFSGAFVQHSITESPGHAQLVSVF